MLLSHDSLAPHVMTYWVSHSPSHLKLETTCLGQLLSIWNPVLGRKKILMSFSEIVTIDVVKQMSLTMPFKSVILFNWFIVVFSPLTLLRISVHGQNVCVSLSSWGGGSSLGFQLRSKWEFTHEGCWLVGILFSFSWVVVLHSTGSLSQMIATAQPERWHSSPLEAWIIHLSSGQMQAWLSQLTWYTGPLAG